MSLFHSSVVEMRGWDSTVRVVSASVPSSSVALRPSRPTVRARVERGIIGRSRGR